MPVYVCFRGDCDNLAFEEGGESAGVFVAGDALGRRWLCVETRRAEVGDPISGSTLDMMKTQGLLHRMGLSFEGTGYKSFLSPDRAAARWHLLRSSHPPAAKSAARLGFAFVNLSFATRRPYTLTLSDARGAHTFYGDSEDDTWYRAAERLCGPTPGSEDAMPALTFDPLATPLYRDADGVIRVGDTRIVLDALIELHLAGETPEAISAAYPRVPPADVYAILAFYHRNKAAVDDYLKAREAEAERLRLEIESAQAPTPAEFRAEARKRWTQRGQVHVASDH